MRKHGVPSGRTGLGARLTVLISVLALLPCAGCGGGGGGASLAPAPSDLNGIAIGVTAVDQGSGNFLVQFTLQSSSPKSLGVEVDFSQDRGLTYSRASLQAAPAEPSALPANPSGVQSSVVWNLSHDITNTNQHDLRVRVLPYDSVTGRHGISGESGVFGLGTNSAPTITVISTPSGVRGGWVSIAYTVEDAEDDVCGIEGEYSLDGGATFHAATLGQGDGIASVQAPSGGAAHSVSWTSQADAAGQTASTVVVRLRAVDVAAGAFVSTGIFSIDTRGPTLDLLTINGVSREMNGSIPFTRSEEHTSE